MNPLSSNTITLQSYEESIVEYVNNTASETDGAVKNWIDQFLDLLPANAQIIEIGSAHGRDAKYIESKGFTVERTDAANGFVELLRSQGYSANTFNILTDEFHSTYDLIFANAVFLHFTPQELESILKKIHGSLKGILAFSVKHGQSEEWSTAKIDKPRYFCYWTDESIRALLEATGFEVISTSQDEKFLQITAKNKNLTS